MLPAVQEFRPPTAELPSRPRIDVVPRRAGHAVEQSTDLGEPRLDRCGNFALTRVPLAMPVS